MEELNHDKNAADVVVEAATVPVPLKGGRHFIYSSARSRAPWRADASAGAEDPGDCATIASTR
jgi:hypothetical protein